MVQLIRSSFVWCLFWSCSAWAQGPITGFLPNEGQLDVALSYSEEAFDYYWDETGTLRFRRLAAQSLNTFVEYGLSPISSLVITAPYISTNATNRAWQDASLWLKYRNQRTEGVLGSHNILTAVGVSFPLSRYPTDNINAIGLRATTVQGRVSWQYQRYAGWFFQLQSGLDFQFAPEAKAALPVLARVGYGTPWVYLEGWIERYQALQGGSAATNTVASTSSSWTRVGSTLYVPLLSWLGIYGGGAATLGGRNIGQALRWNAGILWRFQTKSTDTKN